MKINVLENRTLYIERNYNTQNENEVGIIELQVPESYQDFNKKIVFITDDGIVWDLFQNNQYIITEGITKYKQVQFYIWLTKDGQDFRSQTRRIVFYENQGVEITEEEVDGIKTVVALLEGEITKVEGLEEDVQELITDINRRLDEGEFKGEKGDKGDKGDTGDIGPQGPQRNTRNTRTSRTTG